MNDGRPEACSGDREPIDRVGSGRAQSAACAGKASRDAQEIRAYVSAVRDRQATLDDPLSEAGFQEWAVWALGQADRIKPALAASGRFKWTIGQASDGLYWRAAADGAMALSDVGGSP